MHLFHLTSWPCDLDAALSPPSLESEGFVHLSTADQMLRTARRWFAGVESLGVLVVDESCLGEALRWEDTHGHGEAFPHLYSALPREAVLAVVKLSRGADGEFYLPSLLAGFSSPLWEGPDEGVALIEPRSRFPEPLFPELAVLCFFPKVVEGLASLPGTVVHRRPGSFIGPDPVLVMGHAGKQVAVCSPGVGGPLAAVALEELIARGCRRFVVCGGAGSLCAEGELGGVVLVSEAYRDEGASHHYLPASASVGVDVAALARVEAGLTSMGIAFRKGATWTTDALYRETPSRIARRRAQGCLTVEMEAASLLAVAQFRGVPLVPLLSCGDDLSGESWDFRDWTSAQSVQDKLFWLCVELLVRT